MPRGGAKPGERRGGRQRGTPNKGNADIRALIDAKCDPAALIARLVYLAHHAEMEQTRLAAIGQLLDRRFGRAPQAVALETKAEITLEGAKERLAAIIAKLPTVPG